MQILDGKNHKGGYDKLFQELIVALLNCEWRNWGVLSWTHPEKRPTAEQFDRATEIFHAELRGLVDQFIQTGTDSDGVETPTNRRVRAAVNEPPIPIFDALYEWFTRNQPRPALNSDGTIFILAGQPMYTDQSPEQYGHDMAVYYFQELLASPLWSRIGRCANPTCARYFMRQRQRKTAIKRGSYCGKCSLVGAAERTRRSREKRKSAMLEVAAQAWKDSTNRRLRMDRATWIAKRVNRVFGKVQFVRSKWVNQNRKAIEALSLE